MGHINVIVSNDGSFICIPREVIKDDGKNNAHINIPQHSLVRIYAFSYDIANKKLTWQGYDAQA